MKPNYQLRSYLKKAAALFLAVCFMMSSFSVPTFGLDTNTTVTIHVESSDEGNFEAEDDVGGCELAPSDPEISDESDESDEPYKPDKPDESDESDEYDVTPTPPESGDDIVSTSPGAIDVLFPEAPAPISMAVPPPVSGQRFVLPNTAWPGPENYYQRIGSQDAYVRMVGNHGDPNIRTFFGWTASFTPQLDFAAFSGRRMAVDLRLSQLLIDNISGVYVHFGYDPHLRLTQTTTMTAGQWVTFEGIVPNVGSTPRLRLRIEFNPAFNPNTTTGSADERLATDRAFDLRDLRIYWGNEISPPQPTPNQLYTLPNNVWISGQYNYYAEHAPGNAHVRLVGNHGADNSFWGWSGVSLNPLNFTPFGGRPMSIELRFPSYVMADNLSGVFIYFQGTANSGWAELTLPEALPTDEWLTFEGVVPYNMGDVTRFRLRMEFVSGFNGNTLSGSAAERLASDRAFELRNIRMHWDPAAPPPPPPVVENIIIPNTMWSGPENYVSRIAADESYVRLVGNHGLYYEFWGWTDVFPAKNLSAFAGRYFGLDLKFPSAIMPENITRVDLYFFEAGNARWAQLNMPVARPVNEWITLGGTIPAGLNAVTRFRLRITFSPGFNGNVTTGTHDERLASDRAFMLRDLRMYYTGGGVAPPPPPPPIYNQDFVVPNSFWPGPENYIARIAEDGSYVRLVGNHGLYPQFWGWTAPFSEVNLLLFGGRNMAIDLKFPSADMIDNIQSVDIYFFGPGNTRWVPMILPQARPANQWLTLTGSVPAGMGEVTRFRLRITFTPGFNGNATVGTSEERLASDRAFMLRDLRLYWTGGGMATPPPGTHPSGGGSGLGRVSAALPIATIQAAAHATPVAPSAAENFESVREQLGGLPDGGLRFATLTLPTGFTTFNLCKDTFDALIDADVPLVLVAYDQVVWLMIPVDFLRELMYLAVEADGDFEVHITVFESGNTIVSTDLGFMVNPQITAFENFFYLIADIAPMLDADVNIHRIVAIRDGEIIGGGFNQENLFEIGANATSEIHIAYVEDLRRLNMRPDSRIISDLAENGPWQLMDVRPYLQDDTILVPVRFVAYALGADVLWNQETTEVTIRFYERELTFAVGDTLPGSDVPSQLIDTRTMVPIMFIQEFFDALVTWDDSAKVAEILRGTVPVIERIYVVDGYEDEAYDVPETPAVTEVQNLVMIAGTSLEGVGSNADYWPWSLNREHNAVAMGRANQQVDQILVDYRIDAINASRHEYVLADIFFTHEALSSQVLHAWLVIASEADPDTRNLRLTAFGYADDDQAPATGSEITRLSAGEWHQVWFPINRNHAWDSNPERIDLSAINRVRFQFRYLENAHLVPAGAQILLRNVRLSHTPYEVTPDPDVAVPADDVLVIRGTSLEGVGSNEDYWPWSLNREHNAVSMGRAAQQDQILVDYRFDAVDFSLHDYLLADIYFTHEALSRHVQHAWLVIASEADPDTRNLRLTAFGYATDEHTPAMDTEITRLAAGEWHTVAFPINRNHAWDSNPARINLSQVNRVRFQFMYGDNAAFVPAVAEVHMRNVRLSHTPDGAAAAPVIPAPTPAAVTDILVISGTSLEGVGSNEDYWPWSLNREHNAVAMGRAAQQNQILVDYRFDAVDFSRHNYFLVDLHFSHEALSRQLQHAWLVIASEADPDTRNLRLTAFGYATDEHTPAMDTEITRLAAGEWHTVAFPINRNHAWDSYPARINLSQVNRVRFQFMYGDNAALVPAGAQIMLRNGRLADAP